MKLIRFTGIAGLVFLLFGIIGALVLGSFAESLLLVHFGLGIALIATWFLMGGAQSFGTTQELMMGRKAKFGYIVILYGAVFIAILAIINFYSYRHNKNWDLTEQGVYSLSSQSIATMQNLEKPLKIASFSSAALGDGNATKELLERYRDANPAKVSIEFIDPRNKPHLIEKYGMKSGNLVYIGYGESGKETVNRLNEATEEQITNAVVKLTRGDAKKIYYVVGHGEPSLTKEAKTLADAFGDENLALKDLLLAQNAAVPDDAAAVILASPKQPLRPEEKDMLIKYGDNGGRLMLLTDPHTTTDVKDIADHFGIDVGSNVVVDQVLKLFAGPSIGVEPVIRDYGVHAITKNFSQATITIFNLASTVTKKGKGIDGAAYTDLLKTGPNAWGETNLANIFDKEEATVSLDNDDVKGPLSLAEVYEKKLPKPDAAAAGNGAEKKEAEFDKVSRVVVFGDSDWILGPNFRQYANRDLALNTVNWLAGQEGGISIRPRSMKSSGLEPITGGKFINMLEGSLVVPELILLFGLFVWWRRRAVAA